VGVQTRARANARGLADGPGTELRACGFVDRNREKSVPRGLTSGRVLFRRRSRYAHRSRNRNERAGRNDDSLIWILDYSHKAMLFKYIYKLIKKSPI
jgi:hypothetical protein